MPQFTNQAQLSYNDSVVNSNIAVGEIIGVLSAVKTAVMDEYSRGSSVTYVISIVNSGDTPLTGITVTDDLGGYEYDAETLYPLTYVEGSVIAFINGSPAAPPTVSPGAPAVFSGINVPANGNYMIIYEAEVNQYAPLGIDGSIVNTAAVTGAGAATPVTASETITPRQEPELTITKSISPDQVTENSEVTYTFLIQNYGNTDADASDNAAVTDLFDPILTGLSVSFNSTPWAEPANYNYSEATGRFSTVPGQITVPAATFARSADGSFFVTPGAVELTVAGTISL
ncbi:MAG: hypothetical protein IKS19_08330 [Clostridia bacterium]|nr:hypothetical protein [Clostridia bacterium]